MVAGHQLDDMHLSQLMVAIELGKRLKMAGS